MADKQMSAAQVVAQLKDGMTVGIGGWGPRRKPMALVREILRSPLKDLTIVAYGGADVGMLCAAGKVRELVFGFVSLDSIPYDPNFARARQDGAISVREVDEGMVVAGLRAAAQMSTASSPIPLVSAATWSSRSEASRAIAVAPPARASSIAAASRSMPTTRQPAARSSRTASCPTSPSPMTPTRSPTVASAWRTPCRAIEPTVAYAAASSETPSGTRAVHFD